MVLLFRKSSSTLHCDLAHLENKYDCMLPVHIHTGCCFIYALGVIGLLFCQTYWSTVCVNIRTYAVSAYYCSLIGVFCVHCIHSPGAVDYLDASAQTDLKQTGLSFN